MRRPTGRRADLTGYGSPMLARASVAAPRVWLIPGRGIRRMVGLLRSGLPLLTLYVLALPTVRLTLSGRPTAQVMRDQFNQRRNGRWFFRHAQGVLFLPDTAAEYLRGRSRQAVRTNVRRAREAGLTIAHHHVDEWFFPRKDPRFIADRPPMPADVWHVFDAEGRRVGDGLVTIEGRVALLHIASAQNTQAGWLLQVEVITWLCGRCDLMIVNAEDVPLLSAGMQHFQRLLGYSIVRLRVPPTREELARHLPALRLGLLCLAAVIAVVSRHWIAGDDTSITVGSLFWVTSLVAVRHASARAGQASATAVVGAIVYGCVSGFHAPAVVLGWAAAGVALDAVLARVPRLTWGSLSVAPAGVLMTLLALVVSRFGKFMEHGATVYAHAALWVEGILGGAVAAAVGWWVGGLVMRRFLGPVET